MVRVLLGDAYIDPTYAKDNTHTIQYLNKIADAEGLDLEASMVDSARHGFDKIHNKGIIVDSQRVFVSSINWSNNSPTNNREVGLIIDNAEVARFYETLFWFDLS